ncbi:MAG: class I SAM-dependent methyltransferase [Desulfobacteraceae bacterium]|jgi:SAM-dependent methyltransferase
MLLTTEDTLAAVEFHFRWQSPEGVHTECYYADRINFWRDLFPAELLRALLGKASGERFSVAFAAGTLTPPYATGQLQSLKRSQVNARMLEDLNITLRRGRFYPKGILQDLPGVFSGNREPFRCADLSSGHLQADFNHCLAAADLLVEGVVREVRPKHGELGGTSNDWIETALKGPGMQVRWQGQPTDFFSGNPFAREDQSDDLIFYAKPRLVDHIDRRAIAVVTELYEKLLAPGDRVLDLMTSWKSHFPEGLRLGKVTGLGLNAAEMDANPRLDERLVHDLNQDPRLPFADGSFDAVVCTVSVEYLVQPFAVFREAARVLRPGGRFVTTFSNRWFPPKAIHLWQETHEFERMGIILAYFQATGAFDHLETFSMRGLPRPADDKYAAQLLYSDPIYAVWGQRRQE